MIVDIPGATVIDMSLFPAGTCWIHLSTDGKHTKLVKPLSNICQDEEQTHNLLMGLLNANKLLTYYSPL